MRFSVFPLPILHKHVRVTARRARLKQLTQRISGRAVQLPTEIPLSSRAPCHYCNNSDFSRFQFKSHLHIWTRFLAARAVVKGSRYRETFHTNVMVNKTSKVYYNAASVQLGEVSTAVWVISYCSTNQWEFYEYTFYKLVSCITQEWLYKTQPSNYVLARVAFHSLPLTPFPPRR